VGKPTAHGNARHRGDREAHAARGKKADAAATYRKLIALKPGEETKAAAKEALEALEDNKAE
jgi:hypothetical protein